jgi:hypothetical protein
MGILVELYILKRRFSDSCGLDHVSIAGHRPVIIAMCDSADHHHREPLVSIFCNSL